jgi:hypothetical protein
MKTKKTLFVILSVVVLLAMSVSFATAQGPLPDDDDIMVRDVSASLMTGSFPIQGRLTNAAGNPVADGNYDFVTSLYDVSSGGVALCSDPDANQTVTNGLFNLVVDGCSAYVTGGTRYVGIKVEGDAEMIDRQRIYPVPYAMVANNVEAGAAIQGANSYLFIPGTAIVKDLSTDSTRWNMANATATVYSGNAGGGSRYVFLPITIPAVLYGQNVTIANIRVYYKVTGTAYISNATLVKQTDADTAVTVANEATDYSSTTATYFDIAPDVAENTLTNTEGFVAMRFYFTYTNDTDYVQLAGVRLTLDHTP